MLKQLAAAALIFSATGSAFASSDDAWAEFAAEVEQACRTATTDFFNDATVVVDPFGSESYGLAVVSGDNPAGATSSIICVFDKQTKAVEIGGELEVVVTPLETAD
jgi:hypothetical protein